MGCSMSRFLQSEMQQNAPIVCVDALHPSQKHFSHAGTVSCLPWLKSTKQRIQVSCSRL